MAKFQTTKRRLAKSMLDSDLVREGAFRFYRAQLADEHLRQTLAEGKRNSHYWQMTHRSAWTSYYAVERWAKQRGILSIVKMFRNADDDEAIPVASIQEALDALYANHVASAFDCLSE